MGGSLSFIPFMRVNLECNTFWALKYYILKMLSYTATVLDCSGLITHPHRTAPTLKEEITALEVYLSHPLLGTSGIAGLTGKPTVIILRCVVMKVQGSYQGDTLA